MIKYEDYCKATTVALTTPKIDGIDNSEELIAYAARVSNPNNQMNVNTAGKLLRYCAKNGHWSIFEMSHAVIEIKTTRDIGRQILRHRSFSFQEFSQRYGIQTEFVLREARLQDTKNRQNSIQVDDQELQRWWNDAQLDVIEIANSKYQQALERGIAKEAARVVLPEGLTCSTLYLSGTIRSWIHYCQVRRDLSVQKEHRLVADLCAKELQKIVPSISDLLVGKDVLGQ